MILFKYLKIIYQLIYVLFVVFVQFRFISTENKKKKIRSWTTQMLRILGVELEIRGQISDTTKGILFASNHISWLDIIAIKAWHPMRFVAKKEVRSWPIFGLIANELDTLFIDRQLKGHSKNISLQMAQSLHNGDHVCIFPEGTSTNGDTVLEFKPNLFQAAIDANVPCQPVSIYYQSVITGEISYGPAFIGDLGLLESISNTLKSAPIKAIIFIGPICQNYTDRKALSDEAWGTITQSRPTKA
jgi:1-acyl-sn-glycerol-3-phosphate acyltransferase